MTPKQIVAQMKKAVESRFNFDVSTRVRCPTLRVMAKAFEAITGLRVSIEKTSQRKDHKYSGQRYRFPGKREYKGNRLKVIGPGGDVLFDHDSTETYRCNCDVARWMVDKISKIKESKWPKRSSR